MESNRMLELLFELYSETPRQGPGNTWCTRKALEMIPELTEQQTILDVGSGSGAQTADLWRNTSAAIVAVDIFQGFVDSVSKTAARDGQSHRVTARVGDMTKLQFEDGAFDLIWSEGAIYIMGLQAGLTAWQPLLKDNGHVAVSHICWLADEIPPECAEYWQREYPDITTIECNLNIFEQCGYDNIGHFPLPQQAWLEEYYQPLEQALPKFKSRHPNDADARAVIEMTEEEITLYRKYPDVYGYAFFIAKRK